MGIMKVVVKLNIHDEKDKQKAMQAVSSLTGINSVAVDLKDGKMTVIGDVDPVSVVLKLKKQWNAQIVTVGPPQDPKKDGDKKDGDKKDGDKKDAGKKDGDKKDETPKPPPPYLPYGSSYPHHPPYGYPTYNVRSIEENPNACVIC